MNFPGITQAHKSIESCLKLICLLMAYFFQQTQRIIACSENHIWLLWCSILIFSLICSTLFKYYPLKDQVISQKESNIRLKHSSFKHILKFHQQLICRNDIQIVTWSNTIIAPWPKLRISLLSCLAASKWSCPLIFILNYMHFSSERKHVPMASVAGKL